MPAFSLQYDFVFRPCVAVAEISFFFFFFIWLRQRFGQKGEFLLWVTFSFFAVSGVTTSDEYMIGTDVVCGGQQRQAIMFMHAKEHISEHFHMSTPGEHNGPQIHG